tara:strand:+ start:345 stop:587 length:243 start_codon:yes stop_codon:yes gene_type:complete
MAKKTRGIGDNQNPITAQLEQALSIIKKDVFDKICDLQTNGKVTFSNGAFREADKASEKCLEANDLINNCIQVMKDDDND